VCVHGVCVCARMVCVCACVCLCACVRVCVCARTHSNLQCHDIHTDFHEIAFTVATIITRTGNKVRSPGELPASPVDPVLQ